MLCILRVGELLLDYLHVRALVYGETASHPSKNTLHFEMTLVDLTGICVFISSLKLSFFNMLLLQVGLFLF